MAISFSCSQCGKEYKVKDQLAGKTVTCKACTAPLRVPLAAAATASPEVESLAQAALVEPVAEAAATPQEIEFDCPQCLETVKLDAKHAGKQAQCPACKHIIRVPQHADAKNRDWRARDHRPTLAKRDDDAALAGAWGSKTASSVVSRDALAEADALRKRRPPPKWPLSWWVMWGAAGVAAILAFLIWRSSRTVGQRDNYLAIAREAVKDEQTTPAVAAGILRAAAEYQIHSPTRDMIEANRLLDEARDKFPASDLSVPEKALDRLLVLSEIAATQVQLGGNGPQFTANEPIEWSKLQTDLRRTMSALTRGPAMGDGMTLTFERITKTVGLSGDNGSVIVGLVIGAYVAPQERLEPLSTVALELSALGEAGRAKANDLAEQIRSMLGQPDMANVAAQPPAKVIALHIVLDKRGQLTQVRDPGEGEPPFNVRLGFAEGFARRGEIEKARSIALLPGRFEDRFAALARIVSVIDPAHADSELNAAADMLVKDLGTRDLPDWPLIRLCQAFAKAPQLPAAKSLFDFLQKLPNLSPRSESIRAWAQYELLRGGAAPLSEATVSALRPDYAAGAALSWEALGRQMGRDGSAPASVNSCSPALKSHPLALAGIALGLLDAAK